MRSMMIEEEYEHSPPLALQQFYTDPQIFSYFIIFFSKKHGGGGIGEIWKPLYDEKFTFGLLSLGLSRYYFTN